MRFHFCIVAACVSLCAGCSTLPKAAYRPDWLPASAKIVFTSQWEDKFLPDATFKLKARMTEAEFTKAVGQLGLSPHTNERKYTDGTIWLQWMRDADPRWNPSPNIDTTFVRQEGDSWQLAKYENGFLYYQSINH
jgi:hypothetical protein